MQYLDIVVKEEKTYTTEFRFSELEESSLTTYLKKNIGNKTANLELRTNYFPIITIVENAVSNLGLTYKLTPSKEDVLIVRFD